MSQDNLTPAERRILKLILAGKSNHEIAQQVGNLTLNALGTSISRMYDKLGIENPRQMLARVEELRTIAEM